MFTFGDFNHELDFITKECANISLFSKNLKINGIQCTPVNTKEKTVVRNLYTQDIINHQLKTNMKYFGIHNKQNCCFLNASLQVLMNSSYFKNVMQVYNSRISGYSKLMDIISQFNSTLKSSEVSKSSQDSLNCIYYFGTHVFVANPCLDLIQMLDFEENQHQDAEEFLTKLLTGMHEDLLNCRLPESHQDTVNEDPDEWVEIGKGGKNMSPPREDGGEMSTETILSEWIAGKLTDRLIRRGKTQNSTVTPFFILPLNISHPGEITDVLSAIIHYTQSERINNELERQMLLSRLPQMMVVQLKRFTYIPGVGVTKIQHHIDINLEISIPDSCVNLLGYGEKRAYRLSAVIFHIGDSVAKGHYTVAINDGTSNNKWMYIDDTRLYSLHGPEAVQWLLGSGQQAAIPSQLLAMDLGVSSKPFVTYTSGRRTPYLLFYQ